MKATKRVKSPLFVSSKLDISKCMASAKPLIEEQPYLLHPEIDSNIKDYFSFKISTDKNGIDIEGIDSKKRGEKTIEICNLRRKNLRLNRLEVVFYKIKQNLKLIFDYNAQGLLSNDNLGPALILIYKQIEEEANNEKLTHSFLRKFIIDSVNNFTNYFTPYLDSQEQREIAIQAFKNYKAAT